MKKTERVNYIISFLEGLYPKTPVPLLNRNHFELLVAVLLSAQCTDERVNKVTPKLFQLADNPRDMRTKSPEEIYNIIKPCGLGPQKSKAIHELSNILCDSYNGEVPEDIKALEKLPGVGHKTASVVMAQAFGVSSFPVDTHIHRLAQRWKLTNGKSVAQTEKDLKRHFVEDRWNSLHLQIIYYGREYCPAHACHGLTCPICKTCSRSEK